MDTFKSFFREHKWAILLVAAGLLVAVLLLTIGFWKTLLRFAILLLCLLVGMLLDKNGPEGVKSFFGSLFSKDKSK